ncbi:MAG: RsbRD N-terminal domain-containing protein [Deltaproteobacteria bacterium]|nr:RsbRD N-terminal domain-containing protein [Deltaproteobacteria bacterium]
MKLETLLLEKRSNIVTHWLDLIFETYPPDAQRFFKSRADRFDNPVGRTITEETEKLFDQLLRGDEAGLENISPALENIIRIRATQDFTPSQAIGFIFLLKRSIREVLKKEMDHKDILEDRLRFESRIDDLALTAFDIYMKYREKLYEIKADQAKKQVSGLLRQKGLICEVPEWRPIS